MKIFIAFIFLAFIISCAEKKTEESFSKFDKILGNENILTVDYLVSDFENDFLKRQYPNLDTENAYRRFLTELRDGKTENWKRISQKAMEKFKSSDLRLEMYEFPDSVWILQNSTFDKIESDSTAFIESPIPYIKSRFKYTNPNGTTKYTYSRKGGEILKPSYFDSIIKRELKTPRMNYTGKYMQALESVKNKSEFHKEFYEQKITAGFLFPDAVARKMLFYKIDLDDTLNRKIIVLELAY